MKKGKVFFILVTLMSMCPFLVKSQGRVIVSGIIEEYLSKEKIKSVTIFSGSNKNSVVSNDFGYFSVTVSKGDSCVLLFTHSSFETLELTLAVYRDTFITVSLIPKVKELSGIEISGNRPNDAKSNIGTISIPVKKLAKIPSLFGEQDIVKAIQMLPGVHNTNEGSTGYYVRGGGPDQNLILVDGIPIYNVSHLFGLFSLFPADAVKSVDLIKGGFPARYGGRLSSVLDIKLKDGNKHKFDGSYSVGLLSSHFSMEGPIEKNKSSFFVAGRRTYFDLLSKPFFKNGSKSIYNFYDAIAKLNFNLSAKSNLTVSSYLGRDHYGSTVTEKRQEVNGNATVESESGMNWGNITVLAKWNYAMSSKMNINQSLNYTKYSNVNEFNTVSNDANGNADPVRGSSFVFTTGINDITYKSELDYYYSDKIKFKGGIGYTHHFFTPSTSIIKSNNTGIPFVDKRTIGNLKTNEGWLFLESDISLNHRLQANLGIHNSYYRVEQRTYFSAQPRMNGRVLLNKNSSMELSLSYAVQPVHLLTNNGLGLPVDLWVPATKNVPPQRAMQYSLGYKLKTNQQIEFLVDAYLKNMAGVIEYSEGASFLSSTAGWESKVEQGKGVAYGTEFFLHKKTGIISGWIGYTLSWSKRKFENLNQGKWFWYKYDRRHDLKIVLIYEPTGKFDCAFNFILYSGNKTTIPNVVYTAPTGYVPPIYAGFLFDVNTEYVFHATERNNFTYKLYHRADVSFNFNKVKKRGIRTWNISVYNVYGRQNPFFYSLKETAEGSLRLFQHSIFPLLPSVSYQFNFK